VNSGKWGKWRKLEGVRKRHNNRKEMCYSYKGNEKVGPRKMYNALIMFISRKSTVRRRLTRSKCIRKYLPTLNALNPRRG